MKSRLAVLVSLCALAAGSFAAVSGPADWKSAAGDAVAAWKKAHGGSATAVDVEKREVTVLVEATGLEKGAAMEFVLAGPLTDRAYETAFVTHSSPTEIAAAFDRIGVPRGVPADPAAARYWPMGERVEASIRVLPDGKREALPSFVADTEPGDGPDPFASGVVLTGGSREKDGVPVAATNIPCAVFATYNHAPSLFQFASPLDQSAAYGRFTAGRVLAAGTLAEATFVWNGKREVKDWLVSVAPGAVTVSDRDGTKLETGDFRKIATFLRESGKSASVYLELSFDRALPLSEAIAAARFFEAVDGKGVRVNGRGKGQIYFRGFVPRDEWRDRAKRMAQPFEIRLPAEGPRTFVFVEEDWSGEGMEPALKPHETKFSEFSELPGLIAKTGRQGEKMDVVFVYLPASAPIAGAMDAAAALAGRAGTVYVFSE